LGAPRCTGVTKTLANKNHSDIRMYLDSCQTAMVLASGPSLAILAGVLALIFPYAVGVVAVLSAAVGIGLLYLGYLRDISSLSAVILRYHYFLITGGPQ